MVKHEEVLKLFGGRKNFIDFHQQATNRLKDMDGSFEIE